MNSGGDNTVTLKEELEDEFNWFVRIIVIWVVPTWKDYFGANLTVLSKIETKECAISGLNDIFTGESSGSIKGGRV